MTDELRAEVERRMPWLDVTRVAIVVAFAREKVGELQKRIDAALECPGQMCGHCIEILTGDISPDASLKEYLGPCEQFRRSHLYQLGCSDCGKEASEHRAPPGEEG
jgi:hypothetical protein